MLDQAELDNDERYSVPALDRGLRILGLFTREQRRLSLADIARALDLSRSSVFRLIFTLERGGFLSRVGDRQYQLGTGVLRLGFSVLAQQDVAEVARPLLEALRDRVQASAHLGVLVGAEVLYLVRAPSHQAMISNVSVGSRLPALRTTMGRILLASLPAQALQALYPGPDILSSCRLRELAADHARGFVAAESAYEHGLVSIAAPVLDRDRRVIAAINVSAPTAVLPLDMALRDVVPHVVAAATGISRSMGLDL